MERRCESEAWDAPDGQHHFVRCEDCGDRVDSPRERLAQHEQVGLHLLVVAREHPTRGEPPARKGPPRHTAAPPHHSWAKPSPRTPAPTLRGGWRAAAARVSSPAGAAETSLHLVSNHEHVVLRAEITHAAQVALVRHDNPRLYHTQGGGVRRGQTNRPVVGFSQGVQSRVQTRGSVEGSAEETVEDSAEGSVEGSAEGISRRFSRDSHCAARTERRSQRRDAAPRLSASLPLISGAV